MPAPTVTLINGDSLTVLKDVIRGNDGKMISGGGFGCKVDAVVTDPPYGFDFAGDKEWDSFEHSGPDGMKGVTEADHSAAFAHFTRDWTGAAMRDHLRPGGHLLAFSADRTIDLVGRGLREAGFDIVRLLFWLYASGQVKNPNDTRPGCEPIFVGRKPFDGSLTKLFKDKGLGQMFAQVWKEEDGKHPTNMIVNAEAVALDPDLSRLVQDSKACFFTPGADTDQRTQELIQLVTQHLDGERLERELSAIFCAKPSEKDRDYGCADLPLVKKDNRLSHMSAKGQGKLAGGVVKDRFAQNWHPTVKPITLMRRLIRLVSRPGHTILDPFLGSGTTGIAAVLEGRNFIGIERESDYFKIASTRVMSAVDEYMRQTS